VTEAEIAAMKAENERIKSENEELKKKKKSREEDDEGDDEDDEDEDDKVKSKKKKKSREEDEDDEDEDDEESGSLRDKVRRKREDSQRRGAETKRLETAVKFNLSIGEFAKTNSDLLPEEIPEILKAAEKESYDSEVEKANAVKAEVFESFFAVQSNLDLLTTNQKAAWDRYGKLTVKGKADEAEQIFENLFEPALETLRKVRKAEDVGKSRAGLITGDKVQEGYKNRLVAGSRKTYLGEKGDK